MHRERTDSSQFLTLYRMTTYFVCFFFQRIKNLLGHFQYRPTDPYKDTKMETGKLQLLLLKNRLIYIQNSIYDSLQIFFLIK